MSGSIGPTAIVRREEWQQIVRQTPAGAYTISPLRKARQQWSQRGHKILMQRFESCRPSQAVVLKMASGHLLHVPFAGARSPAASPT
jgi:hypothetical protein